MSENTLNMTQELAMNLVRQAESMDREGIARLQKERLHTLLDYVREHSPLLKEKYRDLPARPALADIPPMIRAEGAARFDDWVCDRDITTDSVQAYLNDLGNLPEPYLGRYRVLTTSGTTDKPLIMVRDDRHNMVNAALMASRLMGGSRLGHIRRLKEPWLRSCGIMAGGGFHSAYQSYRRMEKAYQEQGMGDRIAFYSIDTPLPLLVEKLNALQPEIIGAYPSTLSILARAQNAGQLRIKPLVLFCSAEHLSDETQALIESAFGCPAMNNYCSTEAGEACMLCSENHMHVNNDWIIMEAVDANLKPVTEGFSDGVLLTNLANLVQPVIRYYISDRVILHDTPCACGSPFPYLEIEGRKEDILEFAGEDGPVLFAPSVLMVSAMHVDGCLTGQFIQRSPTDLEIRSESLYPAEAETVRSALEARIRKIFAENHAANVRVYTSEEPVIRGKSGKLRCAFADFS